MSKYKLVPVEPTDEMVLAGSEGDPQFFEHARFVWAEMWKAAPEVSAEPCGWQFHCAGRWFNPPDESAELRASLESVGTQTRDVYAHPPAPQPAAPDHIEDARGMVATDIWNAALTLAHNICVQESDRFNRDDYTDEARAANECAISIRAWMDVDHQQIAQMVQENKA